MGVATLAPSTCKTVYPRWVCLGKSCGAWAKDDPENWDLDHWRRSHEAWGHRVVFVPPLTDPKDGWIQ